jgi:GDPmannose 4,6-dehydratase
MENRFNSLFSILVLDLYYDVYGNLLICTDKDYERPSEVNYLLGNASKAKKLLGWEPKIKFKELISIMIHKSS